MQKHLNIILYLRSLKTQRNDKIVGLFLPNPILHLFLLFAVDFQMQAPNVMSCFVQPYVRCISLYSHYSDMNNNEKRLY